MSVETKSINTLITYMKKLEGEIRDIRQRLEDIERTVNMNEWTGTKSMKTGAHLQKIDIVAKRLVDTIDSANVIDKDDPLNLLVVPEVPERIYEVKTVLSQLRDSV